MSNFITTKSVSTTEALRRHLQQNADQDEVYLDRYTLGVQRLAHNAVDMGMARTLYDFLCVENKVKNLSINQTDITPVLFRYLFEALEHNRVLSGISMRGSALMKGKHDMRIFVRNLYRLTSPHPVSGSYIRILDLCSFKAPQTDLWVKAITEGLCLATCCIEELNLALMGISSSGAMFVAGALSKNRSLRKLVLQGNAEFFSEPTAAVAFRDALIKNSTIYELNLNCTGLKGPRNAGEESTCTIEILLSGVEQCTSLHSIAVGGNEILSYGVERLADIARCSRTLRLVSVYRPGISITASKSNTQKSKSPRLRLGGRSTRKSPQNVVNPVHTNESILENEFVMHHWVAAANANPELERVVLFLKPPESSDAQWYRAYVNLMDALAVNHLIRSSRESAIAECLEAVDPTKAPVSRSVSVPNFLSRRKSSTFNVRKQVNASESKAQLTPRRQRARSVFESQITVDALREGIAVVLDIGGLIKLNFGEESYTQSHVVLTEKRSFLLVQYLCKRYPNLKHLAIRNVHLLSGSLPEFFNMLESLEVLELTNVNLVRLNHLPPLKSLRIERNARFQLDRQITTQSFLNFSADSQSSMERSPDMDARTTIGTTEELHDANKGEAANGSGNVISESDLVDAMDVVRLRISGEHDMKSETAQGAGDARHSPIHTPSRSTAPVHSTPEAPGADEGDGGRRPASFPSGELRSRTREVQQSVEAMMQIAKELRHLALPANQMTTFPSSLLEHFTMLEMLDLSNNRIEELPPAISSMKVLHTLRLANNKLRSLPLSLSMLSASLKLLDVSGNPIAHSDLKPLAAQVSESNTAAMLQLLSAQWKERSAVPQVKILVLGHGNVGKTTCIQGLRQLEKKRTTEISTRSTIAVDVSDTDMQWIQNDEIEYSVWDFAGQLEYLTTHQYFLSKRNAVYVIMVDISEPIEIQEQQLSHWLMFLSSKLPPQRKMATYTYSVMVVGSKKDGVITPPGTSASVKNAAITTCARQLQLMLERQRHLPVLSSQPVLISVHDIRSLADLRSMLRKQARQLLSSESLAYVPRYFSDVRARVREWAKKGSQPSYMEVRSIIMSLFALSLVAYSGMQLSVLQNLLSESSIRCDEAAIQFLHDIGVVVFANHTKCVCIRPQFLAKAMAVFVCPDEHLERLTNKPTPMLTARHAILSADEARSRVALLLRDGPRSQFVAPGAISAEDTLDGVMHLLEEFDLCYRLSPDEVRVYGEEGYLFPSLRPIGELFLLPPMPAEESQDGANESAHPLLVCAKKAVDQNLSTLPNELFFRLQVRLRKWHDHRYKLYCNGMLLDDGEGNQGLVVLDSGCINFVLRGSSPRDFLDVLCTELYLLEQETDGISLRVSWLCPLCVQVAGCYRTVLGCQQNHSRLFTIAGNDANSDLGDEKDRDIDDGIPFDAKTSISSMSVDGSRPFLERGVPVDPKLSARNVLWDPVLGDRFYEGDVTSSGSGAGQWFHGPVNEAPLECTVLTADETELPRRLEYSRVRDMFFKFVGKDREKDFELTKVVFLRNPALEDRFEKYYRDLLLSSMLRSDEAEGREEHDGDDEEKLRWRRWILAHLHEYVERVSGNERVNLVAAWHGTSEAACYGIGSTGFRPVRPLDQEQLELLDRNPSSFFMTNPQEKDPGYFGRGIYFTQFPSYGDEYVEMCRKASVARSDEEPPPEEDTPLLLSWVLLGRVWPVVNGPNDANNFYGKPCKPGYTAHYTVVNKQKLPCAMDVEPYYDELVVFDPAQILPRYLIYYRRTKKQGQIDFLSSSHDLLGSSGGAAGSVVASDQPDDVKMPVVMPAPSRSQSMQNPIRGDVSPTSPTRAISDGVRPSTVVPAPINAFAEHEPRSNGEGSELQVSTVPPAAMSDEAGYEWRSVSNVLKKPIRKIPSGKFDPVDAGNESQTTDTESSEGYVHEDSDITTSETDDLMRTRSGLSESPTAAMDIRPFSTISPAGTPPKGSPQLRVEAARPAPAAEQQHENRTHAVGLLSTHQVAAAAGEATKELSPRRITPRETDPEKLQLVLWIDPHPSVMSYRPLIRQSNRNVNLVQLRSGEEAKVWMSARAEQLQQMAARNGLRIITNRNRPGDGGSMAGQRISEWLRSEDSLWRDVPVMMFCKEDRSVKHLASILNIIVTCNPEVAVRFAAMENASAQSRTGNSGGRKDDCIVT